MLNFYATPRQFPNCNFAAIWILLIPMLLASFTAYSQVSLQLTPSSYNGFNISCFGASNGSINLTITGGTPPYSILWSTNETTEDLINLPAGYYRVTVNDADTSTGPSEAEITLIEPRKLTLTVTAYKYPNHFNISLYEACNGAISLNATDGVSPYIWLWNDGNTSQNRTSLCAETFAMTVTDANGCTDKNLNTKLFQPDRSDWQQTGNTGTNPSSNFIGTVDSVDLVFKTNNTERLRISSDGTTTIMGTQKNGFNR